MTATTGLVALSIEYTDRMCRPCPRAEARYIDIYRPRTYPEGHTAMANFGTAYRHENADGDTFWSCHDHMAGGPSQPAHSIRDVLVWAWRTFAPELAPDQCDLMRVVVDTSRHIEPEQLTEMERMLGEATPEVTNG